jgi:hypothetical protein
MTGTGAPDESPDAGRHGPPRDEIQADEAQTERQAPNEESPGIPASGTE